MNGARKPNVSCCTTSKWLGRELNPRHADFQASGECSFMFFLVLPSLPKFHPIHDLTSTLFRVVP
jgi:hypothetical protein